MPHFYKEFRKPSALARAPFLLVAGASTGVFATGLAKHAALLNTTTVAHAALAEGNPLPILLETGFWQSLSALPGSVAAFQDPLGAAGLAILLTLTAWSFVRILARRSWTAVGAYSLALCCTPFVACAILSSGLLPIATADLSASLGLTITTLALGAIAANGFAFLDLLWPVLPKHSKRRFRRARPFAISRSVPAVVTQHVAPIRRRKTA